MKHRPYRLAVLTSHPIQYQAPLFRALAQTSEVDLDVLFCSQGSVGLHVDEGFGVEFAWDVPLLAGYRHSFLKNVSPRPNPSRFFGCVNPQIFRALAADRYDAVWVNGWGLASCWLGFIAAHRYGIPLLLRGETNVLSERGGLKGGARHFLLERLFGHVSAFLAVGGRNADFYAAYGTLSEKVFLAPYAVDNDFFFTRSGSLANDRISLREREGISPDLPVILYCGKFSDVKRPLDLLEAFQYLGDDPMASLVFVGDGRLRGEMQRYVVEHGLRRVHFLGFRNQTELPACYALADVFVLPSGFEPWGLVVNEAMCFALPVIASDKVGAVPDLVHDGVNGFVFPAGNVELLTDCLRRVLLVEGIRRRMGTQSRAIIEHWGINETVRGILQALDYTTACPASVTTVKQSAG
ncbi:MAG: glycosyltransferase family 4 protein [Acidobacteria bacterium]|nr:glycosyltransferase family 4 protein [Acidobacteriota bacterium]